MDQVRELGADYVIAPGHTGIDVSSAPFRSVDVIRNTRGIDAYIDGHSHHVVEHDHVKNLDGKEILLTRTGTAFQNIGNTICIVKVTGQDLLDALEWGVRNVGKTVPGDDKSGESGGFLQCSGLRYTIHKGILSTVQDDGADNWKAGPTDGYRVSDVEIYDRKAGQYVPLDLTRKYMVAGNNFDLRDGGDGFTMFTKSELVEEGIGEDYMLLSAYAKAFDKCGKEFPRIASEASPLQKYPGFGINYEDPRGSGRITIVE